MLEKLTQSVEIIQALGENPNIDDGLSSEELKMKFDEAARIIKAYLNESLVPYVNQLSESMANQLDPTLTRPDLAAQAQAVGLALKKVLPLNGSTAMTGNLPMGGNKVTGLGTPTDSADAVNKAYADQKYSPNNKPTPADIGASPALTEKFTPPFAASNPSGNDLLSIDTSANFQSNNMWRSYIGTEDASTLVNSPIASGAFYAIREVESVTNPYGGYHTMVTIKEFYPVQGRKWYRMYDNNAKRWRPSTAWREENTDNKPTPADIGAAAASHNHNAANITSGALPIARGGTGSTSAADACAALGLSPAMNIGTVYATREKFKNKTVYAKAVSLNLAGAGNKYVAVDDAMTEVVSFTAYLQNDIFAYDLAFNSNIVNCFVNVDSGNFFVNSADMPGTTVRAIVKYIK